MQDANMTMFDMIEHLNMLYQKHVWHVRFEVSQAFFQGNLEKGAYVGSYILNTIRYVENLECLGFPLRKELATHFLK